MGQFQVTLWNGSDWVVGRYDAASAHAAAKAFVNENFPGVVVFPLRWEQPEDGHSMWSAGTSEHGQRVWIRERA